MHDRTLSNNRWTWWCVPASVLLATTGVMAQAGSMVCSADLNGDGVIDTPDEQQNCTASGGQYLCPIEAQACTVTTINGTPSASCPFDATQACVNNPQGVPMCSPHACYDLSTQNGTVISVNEPTPTSDAPVSADGGCTANLRIFPGRGASCRGQGVDTAFQDCCASKASTSDTVGAANSPSQTEMLTEFLTLIPLLPPQCGSQDLQTGAERQSGYCIYIGDYCADSWPLVGCVQQAHSYCCFDSMLARIIQQQGRPQLPSMGGFGTPTAPNCRGFSPAEFQSLDFSKIDLSSYYSELVHSSQAQVEQTFQNNALPPAGP